MSRLLFATEFGANYGHVAHLLPLALALARRGHEPVFAVRDLQAGEVILGRHGLAMLQAPTDAFATPRQGWAATYPAILRLRGYHSSETIRGMLRAWLSLLDLVRPALVVADFSPTATLAARLRGIPAFAMGSGYYCPPRRRPMPILPGVSEDAEDQLRIEERVLADINDAVARCGGVPFKEFMDFLPALEDRLCTFAELDHYWPRLDQPYWGALDTAFGTAPPAWPEGTGPRVLAYFSASNPALPALLEDLGRLGLPTATHLRGLGESIAAPPNVAVSAEPIDLRLALETASLVVCNANQGVCAKALLAGVPLVLLPVQAEMTRFTQRVVALGAGVAAPRGPARPDVAALCEQALGDPRYALAATQFAVRYEGFDPAAAIERLADTSELLLGG